VARRLGRHFIGTERDETYAKAAKKRIAEIVPLPDNALAIAPTKRSEPRVAFLSVIEAGLIAPGTMLTDAKRRHQALVRADGTLSLGQIIGSIHKVGALAQGLPACNGWTFWHLEKAGKLVCIDDMRSEIRAQMRD
jgi:modification methylase